MTNNAWQQNVFLIFQFHKGTIKTFCGGGAVTHAAIFQFHKGTIKTYSRYRQGEIFHISYFNSIKVQLKLVLSFAAELGIPFQFHKGTIKTRTCQ